MVKKGVAVKTNISKNNLRIIGHLDMDAFFASVEERYTPAFKGKPIAVGAEPKNGAGRGVVSTANYKAREYGIHSALPISKAWQLSELAKQQGKPEVIFLPPDFELYEKSSKNVLGIINKFSDNVEQGSIDEFYFDLSKYKTFKKAEDICKRIKEEIKKQEKITCSIGLGANKLISKIAAGINKPDGFLAIEPENTESFLEPLAIRKIPGIGPKTAELLYGKNINIVKALKKLSIGDLRQMLNKWGEDLYHKIRGVDNSLIVEDREVKSIGEQVTFEQNSLGALFIGEEFEKLCLSVFKRFKENGFNRFKTLTITVRFSDFDTKTTSKTLAKSIDENGMGRFKTEGLKLLLPFLDKRKNPKLKLIRLLGIRIDKPYFDHQNALI
jgi:DNA polymerase IV (DinB-like DNA polymerase)